MNSRFSWRERLVVVCILAIVATFVIPPIWRAKQRFEAQKESLSHVDYLTLGEGTLERVEFILHDPQSTIVYFQEGHSVRLVGVNSVPFCRGDKIRISQMRLAACTEFEKLENQYRAELLEAEAK